MFGQRHSEAENCYTPDLSGRSQQVTDKDYPEDYSHLNIMGYALGSRRR